MLEFKYICGVFMRIDRRKFLQIVTDDLSKIDDDQIAFELGGSSGGSDLISYFDGGFGGKCDSKVYRFATFMGRNQFKSVYMTDRREVNSYNGNIITVSHRDEFESSSDMLNCTYTVPNNSGGYDKFKFLINRLPGSINIGVSSGVVGVDATGIDNINIGAYSGFRATSIDRSICLGYESGSLSSTAYGVCIGTESGKGSIGVNSITIGHNAGSLGSFTNSVIMGGASGWKSKQVIDSVMIGRQSGQEVESCSKSVILGSHAATRLKNSNQSVIIGYNSSLDMVGSVNSVIIGPFACGNAKASTSDVILGSSAGREIVNSEHNVLLGSYSGTWLSGKNNIAIGANTLSNIVDSNNVSINIMDNIAIGRGAGVNHIKGDKNIYIGLDAGATINTENNHEYNICIGTDMSVDTTPIPTSVGWGGNILSQNYKSGKFILGHRMVVADGVNPYFRLLWGDLLAGRLNISNILNLTPITESEKPVIKNKGDIIYNNDINKLQYYNGTNWISFN